MLERSGSHELEQILDLVEQADAAPDNGKRLLCAACATPITTDANRISVNGGHAHTFTNPNGVTYQITCFQSASGCGLFGRTTNEFSWFAGFRWQVAVCAGCAEHLGWRFRSDARSFYGLIDERLIRESNESS